MMSRWPRLVSAVAATICCLLICPAARALTVEVSSSGGGEVLDGETWIVGTATVTVSVTPSVGGVAGVTIDGATATYDGGADAWEGDAALSAGTNVLPVEVLDAGDAVLESGSVTVIYVPPENHFSGTLVVSDSWSGACIVEDTVSVPEGIVLTIEAGTVVLMDDGTSLRVQGQLLADGTQDEPIRFTRSAPGVEWKQVILLGAADSHLLYCTLEYADSEGDHKDYYDTRDSDCEPLSSLPSRDYNEALVVVAGHADIEGCVFQKLPDENNAEGDAIAVISDDVDYPGDATANIRGCQFLSIGQGVHTRYSYVLVEDCYFTDHHGDNDDIDLYGESDPPPLILNNVMLNPDHDDMINPTRCSAILIGNVIGGCDDHGIVLRDRCSPVLINNLIFDCSSAGIAVQNQCDALLVNNTIVNCGRGVRFFDHTGRWGLPYCLFPGSGKATLINCIIWDCPTTLTLTESPYTEDHGSHVTVKSCLIEDGQDRIDISGASSTVTWLEGNIEGDPLFVDPGNDDYHLGEESPAINAGTSDVSPLEAPPADDLDGAPRPCGAALDLGAYEYCDSTPLPRFLRGDPNTDGGRDISDAIIVLLFLFAGADEPSCLETADINDDAVVDITDTIFLLGFLFTGGEPPPPPLEDCGTDATEDELTCLSYPPCE